MFDNLRGKWIWIVPLLAALLVAFVGWWANQRVRSVIEHSLREDLQTTLEANVTALEIWMANQKRICSALTEEPRFRSLALELLQTPDGEGTNRLAISRQLISDEHLSERVRTLGYGMAQLVNTNLAVVAETGRGRGRTGASVLEDLQPKYSELFAAGEPIVITPFKIGGFGFRRPGSTAGFPPLLRPEGGVRRLPEFEQGQRNPPSVRRGGPRFRDRAVMQVAAPVKDDTGTTRGALALIINPDEEFTRILSVATTGESGETFAFDSEGLMISESRFDEELKQLGLLEDRDDVRSALNLYLRDPGSELKQGVKVDTNAALPLMEMVTRALAGVSGVELNPFRDYRGVEVIGAWRWLPEYSFGVVTKIDAREAYRPARVVRGVFLILFLLLVLSSLVTLMFTYMQVVWRRRVNEAELKARQLGQYRLEEKIGEGGMGVVYRAHHALLRRETALKLLLPHKADPSAIESFEQEVQLTCRLAHPNTIQVYDYGRTPDGIFYYAMEYLDGLNLGDLVRRHGPQPAARVIYLLRQICESLAEAHGLGLIHRDIKPANLFLSDRGGVPDSLKVLDFGLVKRLNYEPGQEGKQKSDNREGVVGTPHFIAPESLQHSAKTDARSDLYMVGAVGYFLLTGRHVFEGGSFKEVCHKHIHEPPVAPGTRLGRPLCAQLEGIILRCLKKQPDARPQSAVELAHLLEACPEAGVWTVEQRRIWWTAYRTASKQDLGAKARPITPTEATVKIEFAGRAA